jgi:CRISPR system Cascade subunit CasC
MLVEIHMLQNHAPSNLNRDDTGSPKDAFFGGVKRARISSQCIKRSIRKGEIFSTEMTDHIGDRTRKMPEVIKKRLIDTHGFNESEAQKVAITLVGIGTSGKTSSKDDKLLTQLIFFDKAELEVLADETAKLAKSDDITKMNAKSLNQIIKPLIDQVKPQAVDIALFGRMTTGEFLKDVEASMQVAHAIGTAKMENEYDFFTAVDDLNVGGETMEEHGSGHMGDIEFTSTTFYKYFACDFEELKSNLNSDVALSKNTLKTFVKAAALSMPTGKQNTFAAHNAPDVVIINIKNDKIPLFYANAFIKPVSASREKSLMDNSAEALIKYIEKVNAAYPMEGTTFYLSLVDDFNIDGTKVSNINELADKLHDAL